jgi:predicted GNAT family acetyltransferase
MPGGSGSQTVTGIINNPAKTRYELEIDNALALLVYSMDGKEMSILHTEVPPQLGGRGIGSKLAHHVLVEARTQGLKIVPRCSFVVDYMKKHPEFDDLKVG